jgi:riboflavin biosynthesis pyrimidine reductase
MKLLSFDLKWAQTLDGQLCDDSGTSQWITGNDELKRTHEIRKSYDAIIVGASTFLIDKAKLTVRLVPTNINFQQPLRVILDLTNKIENLIYLKSNLCKKEKIDLLDELNTSERMTIILVNQNFKSAIDQNQISRSQPFIIKSYFNVIFLPIDLDFKNKTQKNEDEIKQCLIGAFMEIEKLTGRSIKNVLVEGGARTLNFFIENNLYNEIFVSIAAILTGGRKHRIEINKTLSNCIRFNVLYFQMLGSDILIKLQPKRNAIKKVETLL